MNMKHWHTYEIIKGYQKDERSEKIKVQTQWLSLIDQSASNSYLTDNINCNVALRYIKMFWREKYDLITEKLRSRKRTGAGFIKGIFQLRGL